MIDISKLTSRDIGRRVAYTGKYKLPSKEGIIQTWDTKNIHILFDFRTNHICITVSPKELKFIPSKDGKSLRGFVQYLDKVGKN